MPFQILQSQFPLTSHQTSFKRTRSSLQAVSKFCLLSASISFLLFSTFLSWKPWTRIGEAVSPHKVPFAFKLAWRACSLSRLPSQPSFSQLLSYWLWMIINPASISSSLKPLLLPTLALDWWPVHHRANTQTHTLIAIDNKVSPIHLSCMLLDCGGNQGNPHQNMENMKTLVWVSFCCEVTLLLTVPMWALFAHAKQAWCC